ncbi:hypothetical protein RKD46_004274 [Streptomyces pseudovenezuelae]
MTLASRLRFDCESTTFAVMIFVVEAVSRFVFGALL